MRLLAIAVYRDVKHSTPGDWQLRYYQKRPAVASLSSGAAPPGNGQGVNPFRLSHVYPFRVLGASEDMCQDLDFEISVAGNRTTFCLGEPVELTWVSGSRGWAGPQVQAVLGILKFDPYAHRGEWLAHQPNCTACFQAVCPRVGDRDSGQAVDCPRSGSGRITGARDNGLLPLEPGSYRVILCARVGLVCSATSACIAMQLTAAKISKARRPLGRRVTFPLLRTSQRVPPSCALVTFL